MTLATAALPRTKKMVAALNLVAATVTAVCSSFHPTAVFASSTCLVDRAAGVGCLKVAMLWHAPFVVLDVLGIAFAEAGPRLVRINDRPQCYYMAIWRKGVSTMAGTAILKINSHADLIKYADDGASGTTSRVITRDSFSMIRLDSGTIRATKFRIERQRPMRPTRWLAEVPWGSCTPRRRFMPAAMMQRRAAQESQIGASVIDTLANSRYASNSVKRMTQIQNTS